MKRFLLLILVLVAFLLPGPARAFDDWAEYKTTLTASGLVTTGATRLHALFIGTDGTNAQTIIVYDNTSAAGSKALYDFIVPTSATDRWRTIVFNTPILCRTGIYIAISGSGARTVQAFVSQ
jgi:hypothetical protein